MRNDNFTSDKKLNALVELTGLADEENVTESDVEPKQLRRGIEIEMEHTNDPDVAKQIALDHLAEIPDYYTRLIQMEEEAEKGKGRKID